MRLITALVLGASLLLSACRDLPVIEAPEPSIPGAIEAAEVASEPAFSSAVMKSVRAVDSMPADARAVIGEIGRRAGH